MFSNEDFLLKLFLNLVYVWPLSRVKSDFYFVFQCARDGLVLGMYQNEGGFELTPAAKRFDASLDGSLQKVMER